MTQRATRASVLGSFDSVELSDRGHTSRLERRGDEYWIDMPDPVWFLDHRSDKPQLPPRIQARIVMTTGSHHLQYYWVRRPTSGPVHIRHDNGGLYPIPWIWLIDKQRWIRPQDSFLTPPNPALETPQLWNTSCFSCHSVATQPRHSAEEDQFASRSAELGIACEACHGPAGEHVVANRSITRRYRLHLGDDDEGDPTITNPARLDHRLSVEVCAQCHSFGVPVDADAWKQTGVSYRPGDTLAQMKTVFRYTDQPGEARLVEMLDRDPNALRGRFWPDGTMRVAGREYNGLLESPCFVRGEMSCLSCHSMHDYVDRADQLAGDRLGDAACVECHASVARLGDEHTHHPSESAGSRCQNCHMPHTSFGLLVAMRSHRIDSPSVAVEASSGRPNACNLCHLDRTLEWAGQHLTAWYGQPEVELSEEQRTIAASVRWAVQGDAAQRAIAAWHMGWEPAKRASGVSWQGVYLSVLLADPYAAVRRVAERSLSSLSGFTDFEFDYTSTDLQAPVDEATRRWQSATAGRPDRHGDHLLMDASGALDRNAFYRLLAERDTRPLRISE